MKREKTMSTQPIGRTSSQGTLTYHKNLADMTPEEGCVYLQGLLARLVAKQARERAYLDRRAARGTSTPTDEAYEADQVLEDELITLLGEWLSSLEKGGPQP